MKVLISADIPNNKVYLNNLYGYKFKGKIKIEYIETEIYSHDIELPSNTIVWFSPYLKMLDISKIKVILTDENDLLYCSEKPLTYVNFMRSNDEELVELCNFIKRDGTKIENIVEIGSYQGESTTVFQKGFPEARIFAIDPWVSNYDDREDVINNYNMMDIENNFDMLTKKHPNIIKIKMFSDKFANIIMDKSIDFIYIDGDHSYKGISTDIINWKNKIRPGGFICGHDYNDIQIDTVVKAIQENFPNHKIELFGLSWLIKL